MRVDRTHRLMVGTLGMIASGLLLVGPAIAADLREAVEQLSGELAKRVQGKQVRVAVTDFPDLQGVTSDLGRYIAERLTTRLSQTPNFLVIERRRLGQVLGELKFSMSDLVDPTKARQLGNMLGVEALVVGSVSDLGNQVDVDARIIDIETNRMLPGATVTVSRDQVVSDLIQRGREQAVEKGSGPSQSASEPPSQTQTPKRQVVLDGFVWEIRRCQRAGAVVTCHLMVTNTAKHERTAYLDHVHSYIYDDAGNNYSGRRSRFGNKEEAFFNGVQQLLLPELPMAGFVVFEGVAAPATKVTFGFGCKEGRCNAVLRDIPLEK